MRSRLRKPRRSVEIHPLNPYYPDTLDTNEFITKVRP